MAIYLTGSLAYDRLMYHPGTFSSSILPDQLHNINVSFFIDRLEEKLGGCAGNMAYTLWLLGERPVIVAAAGADFSHYRRSLEQRGLPLEGINIVENSLTAGCYITTDLQNNQIAAFHAAALVFPTTYAFPTLDPATDIALIGPTNPQDMVAHPAMYKEKGIRYIYDPSQQLPVLSGDDVLAAVNGCFLLIGNEYEINLILSKTGKRLEQLQALTDAGIIITLGENGSKIHHKDGTKDALCAVPVERVINPTGAGDAYRAGLIKGLIHGLPLAQCAALGATCAAYCIEKTGTQEHMFTPQQFMQRHAQTCTTDVAGLFV